MHNKKPWAAIVLVLAFSAVAIAPVPAAAQNIFKNFERQIEQAKQQFQQATHGQTPQQQVSQPQASQALQQSTAAAGPPADPNASVPYSSCCTAAAMQAYARRASFLDIVGIKLGMTPKQAFAAVHAFNPKLKIAVIPVAMEVPDLPQSQYPRIVRRAIAYTVGPTISVPSFLLPNGAPVFTYLSDGSWDRIEIQFTTPPNPPLVVAVTRKIRLPQAHPVFASTLLAALRKKYGPANVDTGGGSVTWIYGPDGKLLQRQLTPDEQNCPQAAGIQAGLDFSNDRSLTDTLEFEWDKYAKNNSYNGNAYEIPACLPFTIAHADADFTTPKSQNLTVTVKIGSAALYYASYRSHQEWLEARAEAAQHKEQQAVQKNAAPTF